MVPDRGPVLELSAGQRRWRLNQELSSPSLPAGWLNLTLEQTRRLADHPGDTPAQGGGLLNSWFAPGGELWTGPR